MCVFTLLETSWLEEILSDAKLSRHAHKFFTSSVFSL